VSGAINDRAMFHADNAYYLPAATITTKRMKTNTVSNTAFRGFGGPQGMMVAERAMDDIAWTLGLDPLDVRKRNLYREGRDVTPYGMVVEDNILAEIIERCEIASEYRRRRRALKEFNAQSATLKKGIALTPVKFGISFTTTFFNQAGALVLIYKDGTVQVNHGGTEMGQGLHTKILGVAMRELGLPASAIRMMPTRTDKVPNTSATAASSGSDLNGMAAHAAALEVRGRMAAVAAKAFGVPAETVRFAANRVAGDGRSMSFAELAKRAWSERVSLSATGYYRTLLANGWIFFYTTRGWQNLGITSTFATAPASWNVARAARMALEQGRELARCLGSNRVALIRGEGFVVTGRTLNDAVRLSAYISRNGRTIVAATPFGPAVGISAGEAAARLAIDPESNAMRRGWEFWARQAGCGELLVD